LNEPLERAISLSNPAPDEVLDAAQSVAKVIIGDTVPIAIELDNSGYVVTTLQAGLYHGLTAKTASEAIIDAVMMGGDTDTIGAVAGTVVGARFGDDWLPDQWLEAIDQTEQLRELGITLSQESFTVDPTVKEICNNGTLDFVCSSVLAHEDYLLIFCTSTPRRSTIPGVRDVLVVFDSRGTVPTAVDRRWTGCQSTGEAIGMRNNDISSELLCQIVIAVTLLPEFRDRFRCVLCLSGSDWTRVISCHGGVSTTRIDTQ